MEYYRNLSLENLSEDFGGIFYIEEWTDIKGYKELYQVSSFGRIKSLRRKTRNYSDKILSQSKDKNGYPIINLCKNGIALTFRVPSIVCRHFLKRRRFKKEVNHIKGIKTDNRYHQLEWVTSQENQLHAFRTGLQVSHKGEAHGQAKLSERDIRYIRESVEPRKVFI